MSLETLTTFFAWSSAIHIGLLLLTTLALITMRGWVMDVHSRLLGTNKEDLIALYTNYLAGYKLLVITFALVPYLVLRFAM